VQRDRLPSGSPKGKRSEVNPEPAGEPAGRGGQIKRWSPIEVPPHAIWRDDFDESPPDRWADAEPIWEAIELDLGDGRSLVLDASDPFPEEEWALSGAN